MRLTKRPKAKESEAQGSAILERMKALGLDPLAEIASMLHDPLHLSAEEMAKPEFRFLLQDWEPFADDTGAIAFRPKASIRAKLLIELLQFISPKLRSQEVTGKVDNSITIEIRSYASGGVPGAIIDTQKLQQRQPPGRMMIAADGSIKG